MAMEGERVDDGTLALFQDLPISTPPLYLYADKHVLEPCLRCDGTGKEANRIPYYVSDREALWDPTCRGCNGAGKRLVYVGMVRDV